MMVSALSVKQPWASLIAGGGKTIETRKWYTSYCGPLVICSSKSPADQGPAGVTMCVVVLGGCRRMRTEDEDPARCRVYDDAWSWLVSLKCHLRPVRVRGQLGIFNLDLPEHAFLSPDDRHMVQGLLARWKGS